MPDFSTRGDFDLVQNLHAHADILPLTQNEAEARLENLSVFLGGCDKTKTWWWNGSKRDAFVLVYEEDTTAYTNFWSIFGDERVIIAVTDDEPPPWSMFIGGLKDILAVVMDSNITEYGILSPTGNWAVFDTHHNALICFGTFYAKGPLKS